MAPRAGEVTWFSRSAGSRGRDGRLDARDAVSRSAGEDYAYVQLSFDADHRVGRERDDMGRTTLNLDTKLVAEAKEALGARSQTEAIHMALAHVVRQQRLDALAGDRKSTRLN